MHADQPLQYKRSDASNVGLRPRSRSKFFEFKWQDETAVRLYCARGLHAAFGQGARLLFNRAKRYGSGRLLWVAFMVVMGLPCLGMAQSQAPAPAPPPAPAPVKSEPTPQSTFPDVIAFAEYQGSSSSLGMVMSVDADLGYQFNDRWGAEMGLPLFFVRSPFSPVVNHDYLWGRGIGEPYVDVRYTRPYHKAYITSILTGTIPVANTSRIYGTGRFGVDWFNHLEQHWGNFTPFLNLDASNGAVDRFVMPRPYTEARPYQSLGFLSDYEGGVDYTFHKGLLRGFGLGGSGWDLLPAGPQKVFSRFVLQYSTLAGDGHHNRDFDSAFETVGPSTIDRDNGYSGWIDITRWHPFDLQLGYTHSEHYYLDVYTVTLTVDARSLAKKLMGY